MKHVLLEVGLVEIAIHVEAHNAKAVGPRHTWDEALLAWKLFEQ